jgi:hypothetical protein
MNTSRKYFDSDEMTPPERFHRVVKLLASACLKLLNENLQQEIQIPTTLKNKEPRPIHSISTIHRKPGPIPFGKKMQGLELGSNLVEESCIRRILDLHIKKYSNETIARILNKEDHETKRAGKWTRTAVWRILKERQPRGVTD